MCSLLCVLINTVIKFISNICVLQGAQNIFIEITDDCYFNDAFLVGGRTTEKNDLTDKNLEVVHNYSR